MATTNASAEAGVRLQQQAREKLQGTDAIYGGKGKQISLTPEQSKEITIMLAGYAGELQKVDPKKLGETEKQVLAMVSALGPNGEIDGKQACQILLLTAEIALKPERGGTNKETKRQAEAAARVAEQISLEVMPRSAHDLRDKFTQIGERIGATTDKQWEKMPLVGRIDGDTIRRARIMRIENHPIIAAYRTKARELAGPSGPITQEHLDAAMKESIAIYGNNEVDRIMAQIEAEQNQAMLEEQRRESHRKKEALSEELEAGKPHYEEQKVEVGKLQEKNKQLQEQRDKLETEIDNLVSELLLLPTGIDVEAMRKNLITLRQTQVTTNGEVARIQAEINQINTLMQDAREGKEADLATLLLPLRQETDRLIQEQADLAAESQKASGEATYLSQNQKELRNKGQHDDANKLTDRIAQLNATAGEKKALAESYRLRIDSLNKRIADVERSGKKLDPATLNRLRNEQQQLQKDLIAAQEAKVVADENLKNEEKKFKDAEEAENKRNTNEKQIQLKQAQQVTIDQKIAQNNLSITEIKTNELQPYEAKRKELIGVEKFIKASEQAADQAKKMSVEDRTVDNIRTRFGFDATELPEIRMREALYDIGYSFGNTEDLMQQLTPFDFWRFLMNVFGGAEVA